MISGRHSHRLIVKRAREWIELEARERATQKRIAAHEQTAYAAGYAQHKHEVTLFLAPKRGERYFDVGEPQKRMYAEALVPDGPDGARIVRFKLVRKQLIHDVDARGYDHGPPLDAGEFSSGSPRYRVTWFEWEPQGVTHETETTRAQHRLPIYRRPSE